MKKRTHHLFLILAAASLPFLIKIATLLLGASGYALQSSYKILQLIVPAIWRFKDGRRGVQIFWPVDEPRPSGTLWIAGTLIALALSLGAMAVLPLLMPLWQLDPETLRQSLDARFAVGPVEGIAIVVFLSFANSALEEFHFRIWLDRELSRAIGKTVGILVSAALFGLMHGLIFLGLPGLPVSLIGLIVGGLAIAGACWSLLMRHPGGASVAWWSHGLTDALLLGWGLHWLGYV